MYNLYFFFLNFHTINITWFGALHLHTDPLESPGKCIKFSPLKLAVGDDGGSNDTRLAELTLLELNSSVSMFTADWLPPPENYHKLLKELCIRLLIVMLMLMLKGLNLVNFKSVP